MTRDQIRSSVLDAVSNIAPEVSDVELDERQSLRDQLELDSLDFLNFVVALQQRFGVRVPESDYRNIETVADCVDYIEARSSKSPDA